MSAVKVMDGGVTAARGFRAGAVHAGIKSTTRPDKPDVGMLVSDRPAVVAGVFTTNKIQAAPVRLCREGVKLGIGQALVVNSGCANACTGRQGHSDAREMARLAGSELGVDPACVYVCSTGTIGIPLPMDRIADGIRRAAAVLSSDGGGRLAHAIMTTDTVDKQYAIEVRIDGKPVRIGGVCKGAGMIEPNMATMLAFLTTDADVDRKSLQTCLVQAVNKTFNRICVDGDQSTNDTVLLFANGAAGNRTLQSRHRGWKTFCDGVEEVARELALKIVRDGEGATKFVSVTVRGAASDRDASKAARAISRSLLVKTSWFGCDPNWGRVIAAVGYSGARVNPDRIDIAFDGHWAVKNGVKAVGFSLKELETVLRQKGFSVDVHLHLGRGCDTVYTCDCSVDYVKINAEYMT